MSERSSAIAGDLAADPGEIEKTALGWQDLALVAIAIVSIPLYLALTVGRRRFRRLEESTQRRVLGGVALAALGVPVVLGLVVYVALHGGDFPSLDVFTADQPPTIGRIEDARGQALAELAVEYRRPVGETELPPILRAALLSAEDKRFFDHDGVDFTALPRIVAKAASASWRARRLALPQGGSTLTMQLVRIVFLPEWTAAENRQKVLRDGWTDRIAALFIGAPATNKLRRKVEEIRLALWLERELQSRLGSRELAKEEILRRYAAYIYLGDGRYGFAAAAEHYFGRPLSSFGLNDTGAAALLAGIPKWPGRYAPSPANLASCQRRRNHILGLMAERGYLTEGERVRYAAQPVPLPSAPGEFEISGPSSAVNGVLEAMKDARDARVNSAALFEGRIRVRSTVDGRIQQLLIQSLEDGLKAYEARHPASRGVVQGSAVVLANADARILAVAGGRQVFNHRPARLSDLNRATESRRQPGSAMKPLAYLAAFRQGVELDTEILDAPIAVPMGNGRPPKWISNYDRTFRGLMPIRYALAESRNAATVRLVNMVGIREVVRAAHDLGIHSQLQPYLTTALGSSEVTLLELANAYRAIASGYHAEPWILERVATRDGLELFRHKDPTLRRIQEPALLLVQEALRGVVRLPGATAHSLVSLEVPVMGKTGTTNDFRDALFVGSTFGTSGVTVAVRVGFDDNRSLGNGETGGQVALPVFRSLVERAYKQGMLGPIPDFPEDVERGIDEHMAVSLSPSVPEMSEAAAAAPVASAAPVVPVQVAPAAPAAPVGPAVPVAPVAKVAKVADREEEPPFLETRLARAGVVEVKASADEAQR